MRPWAFEIGFKGQGLDRFAYTLDPSHPARQVSLRVDVAGGDNYDYPYGVVPAHNVTNDGETISMQWQFDALESGVPIGLLLPSETSFDEVIVTMTIRSWATFALFFAALVLLFRANDKKLARFDAYFVSSLYAFFLCVARLLGGVHELLCGLHRLCGGDGRPD